LTALVLDNSVLVQVYVPDEMAGRAILAIHPDNELHVPELLPVEFGNALWKKVRRGVITAADALSVAAALPDLPLRYHSTLSLLPDALALAIRFDRTVYDCLYVALAQRLECRFVTADRRLYNALAETLPGTMLWVEDLPDPDAARSS
jgi:predicted nucleic acid-binding protein